MRKKDPPPNELQKWVPMFLSLMLIILAFFIVLSAFATQDEEKVRDAIRSIQGLYGIFYEGGGRHEIAEGHLYGKTGDTPIDQDVMGDFMINIFENIDMLISSRDFDYDQNITITETEEEIILTVDNSIFFDSGSTRLKTESEDILKEVAQIVSKLKMPLIVEGHTDSQPLISGSRYRDNWELSALRAVNVIRYFIEELDIGPDMLKAKGYAFYQPIASNESEEGRAKNRRVNFVFQKISNNEVNGLK